MAILLGSNLSIRSKHFLDERQELAVSLSDLKNWDLVNNPLPDGFEIYLDAEKSWYILDNDNEVDESTGKFRKRSFQIDESIGDLEDRVTNAEDRLDGIDSEITDIKEKIKGIDTNAEEIENIKKDIENRRISGIANTFNDLLLESNWVKDGINYSYEGILVSVIKDPEEIKNGLYKLKTEDYKTSENWIRILDLNQVIGVSRNKSLPPSDENVYSAKKTDNKFIDRENEQTITEKWNFDNNISFGSNGSGLEIDKERDDYTTLTVNKLVAEDIDINVGVVNFIKNSSFTGDYKSQELDLNSPLNNRTYIYSSPMKYWLGEGTWEIVDEPESVTEKAIKLENGVSLLYQEISYPMIAGDAYILTFRSKGTIYAMVDGNPLDEDENQGTVDYVSREIKFKYSGNNPCIVSFYGDGYITEPKLEWGATRTYWNTSLDDTDPVAKDLTDYNYLESTFKKYIGEGLIGVLLKNVIQVGRERDGEVEEIYGGFSGVCNSKDDILFWAGGTYEEAVELLSKFRFNPNYNPVDSDINLIITASGEIFSKSLINLENRIKNLLSSN